MAELKAYRKAQIAERLQAGGQWTDTGAVFAIEVGGWLDPRNLVRTVETAARKAGIENVGAHTATFGGRRLAGIRRAHQGRGRLARSRVDQYHRQSIRDTSNDASRAAVTGLGDALGV